MHYAPYIKENKMRHTVETKREQKIPSNGYTYMEKHELYPHHSTAKFWQAFLKKKKMECKCKNQVEKTVKSIGGGQERW
jgi:hypothetical protein